MKSIRFTPLIVLLGLLVTALLLYADDSQQATITQAELSARLEAGSAPLILDVRTAKEYADGHIPGAINISHDLLAENLSEIPGSKSDEIIVYCRSGKRAGVAEKLLAEKGYSNVKDLDGHWLDWPKE